MPRLCLPHLQEPRPSTPSPSLGLSNPPHAPLFFLEPHITRTSLQLPYEVASKL